MKIAIRFGDNDFFQTFEGVLNVLLEAHRRGVVLPKDKEKLVKIINELSNVCYFLYQTNCEELKQDDYLQIKEGQLFIDNEVDEYLDSVRCFSKQTGEYYVNENYEFHILDTDLDYPHNNPVYSL